MPILLAARARRILLRTAADRHVDTTTSSRAAALTAASFVITRRFPDAREGKPTSAGVRFTRPPAGYRAGMRTPRSGSDGGAEGRVVIAQAG